MSPPAPAPAPVRKRVAPRDDGDDDDNGPAQKRPRPAPRSVPHLARLDAIHDALQHALSHALATSPVAPSALTRRIPSVLNHLSLATYAGLTTRFDQHDLRRLCWLWEWTPASGLPPAAPPDDPNPFLLPPAPPPKDWTRGSMGFVVSPTSHYSKSAGKRVPAYGIGIEVEPDTHSGVSGGMAAVAKWTADADKRRAQFRAKLQSWVKNHRDATLIPLVPLADLPPLTVHNPQPSSLTRVLASASPKGPPALANSSPTPRRESPVPFPTAKSHSSDALLCTPSSRTKRADPLAGLLTPQTPARRRPGPQGSDSLPTTPVHQRGPDAQTAPPTPSTSRRQALYDRVRLKSLTCTPAKAKSAEVAGGKLTREQIQKLGQEEMRRRCLLGRLGGVAESTWMLFSSPVGSTATPTIRKRKALPASEVVAAVVKSSPVPMSTSEAEESLKLLTTLCPLFLKPLDINGQEWLEMPPTASTSDTSEEASSPTKPSAPPPNPGSKLCIPPASPGSRARLDSAEQLLTRSPRRVKREAGGIRQVREIIRRELELHD